MITNRLVVSSRLASRRLSYLLQSQCRISSRTCPLQPLATTRICPSPRFLSSTSDGGSGDGGGAGGSDDKKDDDKSTINTNNTKEDEEDPFGVSFYSSTITDSGSGSSDDNRGDDQTFLGSSYNNKPDDDEDPFGVAYDDGDDFGKIGPPSQLPPKYRRDAATGKLTGEIEAELTAEEREILRMDPLPRHQLLMKRLVKSWEEETSDDKDDPSERLKNPLDDYGRRVRLAKMALNVLGRTTKAQATKAVLEDGEELGRDVETGFTQHLTRLEFETFRKYMREQHKIEVTEDDLPVMEESKSSLPSSIRRSPFSSSGHDPLEEEDIHLQGITDDDAEDPDNPDLSLKWLTSRAKWEVSRKVDAEGPFDDMLPRDLNITRIVNRKRAKLLPVELLHHNNLSLLRRYISPAGQILHRVRTRLGARDQRRVARLIKRARCLGLIPHSGQFVVEDHGNIYEKDIRENKPWEEELIRRGLVVTAKTVKEREAKEE